MDDDNIKYASNLTKSGAEKLVKDDLDAQMKKISNQYAVKEVGAGSDDMLVNSEYANGKIITIESAGSWTKVNGSWPETADKTYADYGKATKLGIVNKYKKATIVVNKKLKTHQTTQLTVTHLLMEQFTECTLMQPAQIRLQQFMMQTEMQRQHLITQSRMEHLKLIT